MSVLRVARPFMEGIRRWVRTPARPPSRRRRRVVRIISFTAITVLSALATYAAFAAGAAGQNQTWTVILAGISATVAGVLTAIQIVSSLGHPMFAPGAEMASVPQRVPMQLPRDLRDFTGRSPEMKWLVHALTSGRGSNSAVAISAISGQGGVGKTALALHVSHLVAGQFPQGQVYINLRGPEAEALDPYHVLDGVLRELGVAPGSVPDSLDERSRLFRSILGRMRVLVVLDNALNESQVRPLLPGESTSMVLVTSRASLTGLEGIRSLKLNVMSQAEATELLSEIIGEHRVRGESQAAQDLLELCARLPLAIRIVGSRLAANPQWSLQRFVERLRGRHRLLDHMQDGERAIRATLDISYQGLSPAAGSAFCALGSLTMRTFPEWLLEVMFHDSPETAITGLEELLRVDMIQSFGVDRCGTNRYGFHDLLREYSREKREGLANGDEIFVETVCVTGQAYLRNAVAMDSVLRSRASRFDLHPRLPGDEHAAEPTAQVRSRQDALDWFESELVNILLILEQMVECGWHADAVKLAHSLSAVCEERSLWREWETAQRCALDSARSLEDGDLVCISLYTLGRVHHLLGRWKEASTELTAALVTARSAGLRKIEAACLCAQGKIAQLGLVDEAIDLFEQSRRLYEEIGDSYAWAYVTANIGDIFHLREDWDAALREFDRCLPVFHHYRDRWWEANTGIWIADVFRGQGRLDDAINRLNQSLLVMRELGDERRAAVALVHMARAYVDFGQGRPAVKAIGAALPALEKVADRWWEAMALVELGKAYALMHKRAEAIACWERSLPAIEEVGNERAAADVRRRMQAASR